MYGFKYVCERLLKTMLQNKTNIPNEMFDTVCNELSDLMKQVEYMLEGEMEL